MALALAGVTPAFAAPADEAPAPDAAPGDAEAQAARTAEGQAQAKSGDRTADKVFVFGRRMTTSIATLNADPREAPQVINVISGETLAEQGVTSLEQALRNVPGITTQIGEGGTMNGDQFFIHGFSAKNDIYTDGLRDFGVFTRDSFNYGQVEVLKGPSSTTLGRGATGGGINTTTKTPFLDNGGTASTAFGNAEYERATVDWNQVVGDGVAIRINAMAHHNKVQGRDDLIHSDRWGIAPSIGFGLGGKTTLTVAGFYQKDDRVPDYGLPTVAVAPGREIPVTDLGVSSKNFYGFDADTDQTEVYTVTARWRTEVNDWLTLTSDTKFGDYTRYFQQTPVSCRDSATTALPIPCSVALTDNDPTTVPMISVGGPGPYDQTTLGVQNVSTIAVNAPIGGFRNEFLGGWDVSWETNDRDQYNYASRITEKSLLDPAHLPNPTLSNVKNNTRETTAKDVSLFLSDRFWFARQWSVSAGVRQQWYEVDQNTTSFSEDSVGAVTSTYSPISSNTQFTSPRLSLIWEPTPQQSYYVSYSTSATPPGITVSNGSTIRSPGATDSLGQGDLDPEKTKSYEIGAKVSLFSDRVLVQASLFDVKKNNAKEIDPLSGDIISSGDSQEAKGVELGLGGRITDAWSVNVSYAYTDATTTDCSPRTPAPPPNICLQAGNQVPFSPKNAASLWTTYDFTGALAGLQVGGGISYQDKVYLDTDNDGVSPGYTTFDGLVSYGFDRYRISLNAYNLTDELYYSQVHGNRVVPAPGRSFVATLGVAF